MTKPWALLSTAIVIASACATEPPPSSSPASAPAAASTSTVEHAEHAESFPGKNVSAVGFARPGEAGFDRSLGTVTAAPAIPASPVPRLVVSGTVLRLASGERWTAIEASDFNLFNRYLRGDIEGVLRQRAEAGYNLLRVWTAYDICPTSIGADGRACQPIGRLVPREHPDYYTRLPQFLQAAARHGLYIELTAFTGPYGSLFAGDAEMVAHWDRLIAAVRDSTNVIVELINEYDNAPNKGVPLDRMQRPSPPIVASHGSAIQGSLPLQPYWDYATYHPAAGDNWPSRTAHDGMRSVADPGHVPVIANETSRFPDNDRSVTHARDAAAGAALLLAGSCFHSVHGKSSELWTGVELEAARAWAEGARSVPLEFRAGSYVHRQDLESEEFPGVYSRRLPDGREWVVKIRR